MSSMNLNLQNCCTSNKLMQPCCDDRFTSLPGELLSQILSLLTTKDAAAMQVLSKRMRQVFPWITSVDLDESPVCDCMLDPPLIPRYPSFERFVIEVLEKLLWSEAKQPLTRFRLRFGGDKTEKFIHRCHNLCFPYLKPARLEAWISYPFIHYGLRELDLAFYVRNPHECKLPPKMFDSQSLEVLRLDSNIEIDDGDGDELPVIYLPNLKLLHLHSLIFSEDDFISRLVLGCPILDDLSITHCEWRKLDRLSIRSGSLRRLVLYPIHLDDQEHNSNLVLIDTPNLQYLDYSNNLPFRYSVAPMNALVEARIDIDFPLELDTLEASSCIQFDLVKELFNVQHLCFLEFAVQSVYYARDLMETDLPVFRNLRTLELDLLWDSLRLDIVLILPLRSSPFLETLIFPRGLFYDFYCVASMNLEVGTLEAQAWRTTQMIPSCCLTHLKRIEINGCFGVDRELNMIKFLLAKSLILKEFVISLKCLSKDVSTVTRCKEKKVDLPNLDQFENTLKELSRGSNSCSIIIKRE